MIALSTKLFANIDIIFGYMYMYLMYIQQCVKAVIVQVQVSNEGLH